MALILCPDCGKEISDRAPACIHCGAPNAAAPARSALPLLPPLPPLPSETHGVIDESAVRQQLAQAEGGTTCPFCAHHVPAGANVCHCGAYYGYRDTRADYHYRLGKAMLIVGGVLGVLGLTVALAGGFPAGWGSGCSWVSLA